MELALVTPVTHPSLQMSEEHDDAPSGPSALSAGEHGGSAASEADDAQRVAERDDGESTERESHAASEDDPGQRALA